MRVVITGATGNVGTSLIKALADDEAVDSILGIARRRPGWDPAKTEWAVADIAADRLATLFSGADVVVHLAWAIQPSRDEPELRRINVAGSEAVLRAVEQAQVGSFVYASSIGAYSPGPKEPPVDESWPTDGVGSSFYSRHKAEVESLLDRFEEGNPDVRVVRMRPGLIMKGDAAAEIRRLFLGPFMPGFLVRPDRLPVVPDIPGLRMQAVHSHDVGEAFRLAVTGPARGAFNLAAEPIVDPRTVAGLLDARLFPVPARVARAATNATWHMRVQPTPPGWLDMAIELPLMDVRRAREELGWEPRHGSLEAIHEVLHGISDSRGMETPPLDPETGGPARSGEVAGGIGARNP